MSGLKKSETPTIRQRKYAKSRIDGKTQAQAARDAGYKESVALKAGDKIEKKAAVQNLFKDLVDKAGLTDQKLARRLNEGVDAKETKFFLMPTPNGLKKIVTRSVVHHSERRAHLEIALKVKGHLINKTEITGQLSVADILAASFADPDDE